MNYDRNLKYFSGVSYKGPIWLIVIGVILFFVGFAQWVFLLLGLAAIAGGILLIIKKAKGVVKDSEYDASVASNLENLKERALSKLGLDEDEVKEIEPISFSGYRYAGADFAKKGDDGIWRTNKYEAVIFFFSQSEVHCYTYNFNTVEAKSTESTDVYFYKDIVSVSTVSENTKLFDFEIDYEAFKLTTTGGTSISANVLDLDNAQRSINAMRSLVKSKKMS